MRSAALFDLDHTVLTSDTGMSWMRFQRRRGELSTAGLARAIGWSLLYKAGDPEAPMIAAAAAWYAQDVVPMIAPAARHAIAAHRAAGDVVALATGATQYAAESVARGLGIAHTLCSRLEVVDGRFTGKLAAMCFGVHKVTLVEAFARAADIDLGRSTFYSDSYNDLPLLARVGTPVAVNPDVRLWRHARARGWRIEQWR